MRRRRQHQTSRPTASIRPETGEDGITALKINWTFVSDQPFQPLSVIRCWAQEMSRPGRRIEIHGYGHQVTGVWVWLDEWDTYQPGKRFTGAHRFDLEALLSERDELAALVSEMFLLIARHEERERFRVAGKLWCDPHQDNSRNIYR